METGQILGGQVSITQSCGASGEIDVEREGLHTVQLAPRATKGGEVSLQRLPKYEDTHSG